MADKETAPETRFVASIGAERMSKILINISTCVLTHPEVGDLTTQELNDIGELIRFSAYEVGIN